MLQHIETSLLIDPRRPLRLVNKRSVDYLELVDSIRSDGILQPILVRPSGDVYEVVEGAHRLEASREAGVDRIPCLIRELTDDQVMIIQLKAQALRPKMINADYAKRLQEIIDSGCTTLQDLSREIGKSAQWIRDMLRLNGLAPGVRQMVNRGEITIGNAKWLAKLPRGYQQEYVESAVSLTNADFKELTRTVLKAYREQIKTGRIENTLIRIAEPTPHLRSMQDIREECEHWRQAGIMLNMMEAESAIDGWRCCLRWLLHLDPVSLREHEEREIKPRTESLKPQERRIKDLELKQHLLEKSSNDERTS